MLLTRSNLYGFFAYNRIFAIILKIILFYFVDVKQKQKTSKTEKDQILETKFIEVILNKLEHDCNNK